MRISDWSSDVCSSDLNQTQHRRHHRPCRVKGSGHHRPGRRQRSEERRVGKECAVRVDLGGRRIIKKKKLKDKSHAEREISESSKQAGRYDHTHTSTYTHIDEPQSETIEQIIIQ